MQADKTLKFLAVGAAGPSASLAVQELPTRNVSVRAFVHKSEDEPTVQKLGVTYIVVGELSDTKVVAKALEGMDAVFYIAPAALEDEAEVGKHSVVAVQTSAPEIATFRSETALANGVRLHYWLGGNPHGKPMLLWPEFLGTAYSWYKVMPLLAEEFRALVKHIEFRSGQKLISFGLCNFAQPNS